MRIRMVWQQLLWFSWILTGASAWGERQVQTTSFQLHQNVFSSAGATVMRVRVEVVNISPIEQRVKVYMRDINISQAVGLDSEERGDLHYSAWVKNSVFRHVRSRRLTVADVSDLAELVIPAKSKRYLSLSFACLINNVSETSYTCSRDETTLAGYVPPFPLSRVEASVGGRFEIITTGANMDRGALLASYSVTLLFGLETQELTREINGGRPF